MPTDLDHIETPAALVDVEVMRGNLEKTARYCAEHGLAWRPHAKTHKTPELAAIQVAAGAVGVTVATPAEAEVMAETVSDILLAYPPFGERKLKRLMNLPRHVRLAVALDSAEALRGLAAAAREAERRIGVLIEVDVGMRRVGVQSPEAAADLAGEAAATEGIDYRGVLIYPGHIRQHVSEQQEQLRTLAADLARLLDVLHSRGLDPEIVSGGSTPTLWHSHLVPGVTEIRPGTNIFNDRTTVAVGACEWDECAYSVLATVVSTSVPGQVVVDAGAKALAKEELRGEGGGYGAVLGRPEVVVKGMSEEHGLLDITASAWRPRVGDRVRIVPNHVCVSVNLQERLIGVRGDRVVEEWQVAGRRRLAAV